MLDVSNRASEAINSLTAAAGHAGQGGLRISSVTQPSPGPDLALTIADRPSMGDEIAVGAFGSRVFLDHTAAHALADRVLDVRDDNDGKVHFTVHDKR
ncbi:iron-sulfur cluster biosynthesis protein [Lentzea sp. NPDC051838]|uniref:iron-sulfur cluster biosynthesis protein n=1 Tax=Lentzea sp. NPDC051838 TaxID=3154849 RepID=UPI003436D2CA